jgi:hypothetical protein
VAVIVAAGINWPMGAQAEPGVAGIRGAMLAAAPDLRLPNGAVVGSTAKRRAAWEALSAEGQEQTLGRFRELITPKIEQAAAERAGTEQALPAMKGILSGDTGAFPKLGSLGTVQKQVASQLIEPADVDADQDGLPEGFESGVADAFTPYYVPSYTERNGTGFASFKDQPKLETAQVFPVFPPRTHYRVAPLGFETTSDGTQYSIIRLDYLTLWNRDDGLATLINGRCFGIGNAALDFFLGVFGLRPPFPSAHEFDEERSIILAAAPTSGSRINLDPAAYRSYVFYTAAHEEGPLDHSMFFVVPGGDVANTHRGFAETLSKHSTYPFFPDGYPLTPAWIINSTYAAIYFLYDFGIIDDYLLDLFLYIADNFFYGCLVERHITDFTGWFPESRVNVGEPDHPLPGYTFIQDPKIRRKLEFPPFTASQAPPAPRPVQVSVDKAVYLVGQAPLYTVTGPPNTPILWSSTRNGVSTGEVDAYYGQQTDASGNWSGYGGAWEPGHVGSWTKSVRVGDQTATVGFTVQAQVRLTVDKNRYVVGESPFYTVTGPPNTPILWSSMLGGESTGEVDAYYGQTTDANGNWSGYGGAWQPGHVGSWVKIVKLADSTALAGFEVAAPG